MPSRVTQQLSYSVRVALSRISQKQVLEIGGFLRDHEQVPHEVAPGFFDRIAGHLLASAIEAHDPAFAVEHDDQRADGVEDRRDDVALFLQRLLHLLEFRDVEADAVNEPGLAVVAPHQPGFAMKPDHAPVARHHPIRRPQRLAGKKHLRGFDAPAVLIVGMDLLVPANRILQPFFLRKSERRFDLRTHIGFADSLIQVRHEHHGGNLIEQDPVARLQSRARGLLGASDGELGRGV